MSDDTIPMKEWLKAFQTAAGEYAESSMRFDKRADLADDGSRPGAYIAILSEHNSVHLGLSASPAGLKALAHGVLSLRHEETLTDRDVVDSVSEVMNIVAGKVKSAMSGRDGQLRLGLPMYIPSPIAAGPGMETASTDLKLGPVSCRLSVYRRTREQRRAA